MKEMGNECLTRYGGPGERLLYSCDHCRQVLHWPPHTIATVRVQRSWFFCQRSCWISWMRGAIALST